MRNHVARISELALIAGVASLTATVSAQSSRAGATPPASFVEHNDVRYAVEKSTAEGVETKRFHHAGRTFTADELRAHVAAEPPSILTPTARAGVEALSPADEIDLVIVLRPQPAGPIRRQVEASVVAERAWLRERIQEIAKRALPVGSRRPEDERALVLVPLSAADVERRRSLAARLDELERDARAEIARRLESAVEPDQNALALFVEDIGGAVTARMTTISMLGVRLAAASVGRLAAHPLVARIDLDHPGAPELDTQQFSLGLTTGFWAAGITGGVYDVGVLDTGVQQDHPALSSHRFLSNMGPIDTSSHGTGMAGILASTSELFPGMAFGSDTIVVSRAGSIATSMSGLDYIAGTGEPENVNYSFGNGRADTSDYAPVDQFFDAAIDTFGFMVSKSTGNGGYSATSPTITHPAPAYNLLASANMDDFNTIPRDDDRITASSSTGPTLAGRKKPDLTAPGTSTMSTHARGGFANIGGTSAASPHTGGGIVLLYDMGTTNVMAGKALLLNTTDAIDDNGTSTTADDVFVPGSLWNRRYGWGYLNLGTAYLHGLDVFVDKVTDRPEDRRLYVGQMFTNEKATLVWQRHVAYNGTMFPTDIESLSDLDLHAYREVDGTELASSTSPIDNVEQLHVPEDARVVIKVAAAGMFDPDLATETFALATEEEMRRASGPTLAVSLSQPDWVAPGQEFLLDLTLANAGDLPAHALSATLQDVAVVEGPNFAALGSLSAGQTARLSWVVRAPVEPGTYAIQVVVESKSYGERFVGRGAAGFTVKF